MEISQEQRKPLNHFERRDYLLMLVIFLLSLLVVIFTLGDYGYSWDEAYYFDPSVSAAQWLTSVLSGRWDYLGEDFLRTYWEEIDELPSVVKLTQGLSIVLFQYYLGPIMAQRLPSAFFFAGTLVLLYVLAFLAAGRGVAVFSVLIYGLLPRIFGHAHFGTTETTTVFMTLLAYWFFLQGLKDWRWAVGCGIVFGLALATKINCWFLPLFLLPWAHGFRKRDYVNNFFSMVFLGPVVLVLCWPWLWHETAQRLLDYLRFHATHQFTAVFYWGKKFNYGGPLAPWHYPWVMSSLTLPVASLLLMLWGMIKMWQRPLRNNLLLLYFISGLGILVVASLPFSPKYDGVRLFLPAFAFLAIIGGKGAEELRGWITRFLAPRLAATWSWIILGVIIVVPAGWKVISYHPCQLSYYNILIGGIAGASARGMETSYWGEAVNEEVIDYLNTHLPEASKVRLLALHEKVFTLLQRWGELRTDIDFGSPPPYDYHLLQVRKGFFARPEWYLFTKSTPVKAFSFKGVPLLLLYQTGEQFEQQWPARAPSQRIKRQ